MIQKNLTLVSAICMLLMFTNSKAQVAAKYFFNSSTGTYTPVSGGTVIATATGLVTTNLDSGNYPVSIPFSFTFNGTAYNSCTISANGYITFGTTAPSLSSAFPISVLTAYDGAISAMGANLWGLFVSKGHTAIGSSTMTGIPTLTGIKVGAPLRSPNIPAGTTVLAFDTSNHTITLSANATATSYDDYVAWPTGEISTATTGTAPNRVFIIQYKDMGIYSNTAYAGGGINFQIQLEEGGGIATQQQIKVVYGTTAYLSGTTTTVQVGLRGTSSSDFLNRQSTTSWYNTAKGTANSAYITLTNAVSPQALVYTWSANSRPVAAFSLSNPYPSYNEAIICTDLTMNTPQTWKWYLNRTSSSTTPLNPNAFSPSDTVKNPIMTIGQSGTFDICLVATNAYGSDTLCKNVNIPAPSSLYQVCAGASAKRDTFADDAQGSLALMTVGSYYLPSLIGTCGKGFSVSTCADTLELTVTLLKMRVNVFGSQGDSVLIHAGSKTGPVVARMGGTVIPPAYQKFKVTGGSFFVETILANSTGLSGDSGYALSWKPVLPSIPVHTSALTASQSVVANSNQTVNLMAKSSLFKAKNIFISEIAHERSAIGQPAGGWPAYLTADDYVELTGYPYSDIAGFKLEEWTGTTLQHSVTFPGGTIFNAAGTMILATGQLGTSVPSPADFYYHTGNTISHNATDQRGYILKNASGVIVDAVVYGSYSFPAASGVTGTDWSGTTSAVSGSGIRLNAPDNNTSASWISSGTTPQDPNGVNPGVTVPLQTTAPGFIWSYAGTNISTSPALTVGPFKTPGIYKYVATYGCGVGKDSITITATSTVPVKLMKFTAAKENSDVVLTWKTASEINSSRFEVERSADGKKYEKIGTVKAAGNSTKIVQYLKTDETILESKRNSDTRQLYYRLKMVDNDGTYEYSDIAVVALNKTESRPFSIVPNPSNDRIDLYIDVNRDGTAAIDVIDITGKTVLSYNQELKHGNTVYPLQEAGQLKPGIYFVNININGTRQVARLLKQ
jgi:hypothetical protein